jgi:hypothetical protein
MIQIKVLRWFLMFAACICIFTLFNGCETLRIGLGNDHGYEQKPVGKGPPPWAPAHGYRAKHKYRYFPSSQVYYEDKRGVYFYYHDGKWRVSASLPKNISVTLGDYVTLEMDTDKPYSYHKDVVTHYPPGQLKKKSKKKGKGRWK